MTPDRDGVAVLEAADALEQLAAWLFCLRLTIEARDALAARLSVIREALRIQRRAVGLQPVPGMREAA